MGQRRDTNYDESAVDMGTLPDPLAKSDGSRVERSEWESHRMGLVDLIAEHQFGFAPETPFQTEMALVQTTRLEDETVSLAQYVLTVSTDAGKLDVDVAIFKPANQPVRGVFYCLNFQGNHALHSSPEIRIPSTWMRDNEQNGVVQNRAGEAGRGKQTEYWPLREMCERGFALVTAYYGDWDPDYHDGFENGLHALFPDHKPTEEAPARWGTIAAWSWGLSRMLDEVSQLADIRDARSAVVGHSRLGKTALWAGATDPRFEIVVSNNSGCGGAALERRNFGETVETINKSFPHWFCENFKKYSKNEKSMPHDSHFLIASIAPRPVYIASATNDRWADPRGEYLSGYYASSVYEMLGLEGLKSEEMPPPDTRIGKHVGYHLRTGDHHMLQYDWRNFMDFADEHWSK